MSSTEDRLIAAAIDELVASGYRGATTRSIADRAGVNEVTLFRRFGSKIDLIRAAIQQWVAPFQRAVVEPTDDLALDLERIAQGYVDFVDANPAIVSRLLPEMMGDPELASLVMPIQAPVIMALRAIIDFHQSAGRLVEEPADDALRAFIGPLAARPVMAHLLAPQAFDATSYVVRYLDGRGT